LMAAAMRAKQSQSQDGGQEKSSKFESSELGFASLDDEPKGKEVKAEPAKGRSQPLRAKSDRDSDTAVLAVARPIQPVARPQAQVDLLSDLLAEDPLSGAPGIPAAPIMTRAAYKSQKPLWLFIGIAGFAIFLVFFVLVIWFLFSSPSTAEKLEYRGKQIEKNEKKKEDSPHPDALPPIQAPPAPVPAQTTESPAPPKPENNPQPQEPQPAVVENPPPAPVVNPAPNQEPPPQTPPETPKPPETATPTPIPNANTPPENKPPENKPPENKPPENTIDNVEKERLLANISEMAIQVKPLKAPDSDPAAAAANADPANPQNKPDPTSVFLINQAGSAATRCTINVVKNSTTLMEIEVKEKTEGDKYVVELIAVLKSPAQDGKVVPIWNLSQQVVSADSHTLTPQALKKLFSNNSSKFFKQFEKEVRLARSKVKPK
jgi:hypothetical protein